MHLKHLYPFWLMILATPLCSQSTTIQPVSTTTNLQQSLHELVTQRADFIQKHDREKRLPALNELHQKLKSCPAGHAGTEACKALQREFWVLTLLYFRSLTSTEKKQLRVFSRSIQDLYKKAAQEKIQLTRQGAPFDLLFI